MLAPRAIVFDLDGTLLDTREDIVRAVNHALEARGKRPTPAAELLLWVGDGAELLCARAAGLAEDDPEVSELARGYVRYYLEHPMDHTTWMPGAREALEQLAGYRIALCTNKPRAAVEAILDVLGVRSRFSAIVAGGDMPEKKPHPGPILAIAERLGVTPSQMVVVGDGPQDVMAGARAGARTIGVLGPIAPADRLAAARPDVLLDSMTELPKVLERWADVPVKKTSSRPPKRT
jgi:2-phosphoglycolate phosphatase